MDQKPLSHLLIIGLLLVNQERMVSLTMEPFHRNDLVLSIMFVLLSFKDSYRKHKIVDTNFDWMHQLLLLKSRSSELKWFNIPMQ